MNEILCRHSIYCYMEDYINSISGFVNAKVVIYEYEENLQIHKNKNMIFIQSIPDCILQNTTENDKNIYLLNTEQMFGTRISYINSYPSHIIMIDYIHANLKYYDSKFTKYILPYQLNHNEIFNIPKTRSVCIIGDDHIPPNRMYIVDELKKRNIQVDVVSGFNKKRDDELFQYKIILNIGYTKEYNKIEPIRCDRCIYNGMIVVSDIKEYISEYYLKSFIIFEDYSNIPDKVVDIVNNYEIYFDTIFKTFHLPTIQKDIENISNDIRCKFIE